MEKCVIKNSGIASACVWMIVLAGYPFDFRYAFGYPFLIPILIGILILLFMLTKGCRHAPISLMVIYTVLAAFWLVQMTLRVDVGYLSNVFQVLCVAIICLAITNLIGLKNMTQQFIYFMIANCIGGTIIMLLLFIHNFPPLFQFEQHDGRIGSFYYLTFTNTAFITDSFTTIRYSGMFDEPGAVSFGCMFALILNKLSLKSKKAELLLLILPLFTFSLAHFVTAVLYVIFFYWKKFYMMLAGSILLFSLYLLLDNIKDTEYSRLYSLTIERLKTKDEGSRRDMENEYSQKFFKQEPLTGYGKTFFEDGKGKNSGVNGTNIYYNGALYGIWGYVFPYIIIHYMIFFLFKKHNEELASATDGIKSCILIVANLFQRSYVTNIFPLFALTLTALWIQEVTKNKSHIITSICSFQRQRKNRYLQS